MTIIDGQLGDLDRGEIVARMAAFRLDFTAVTTAPELYDLVLVIE